jgi:hypothetical protein
LIYLGKQSPLNGGLSGIRGISANPAKPPPPSLKRIAERYQITLQGFPLQSIGITDLIDIDCRLMRRDGLISY